MRRKILSYILVLAMIFTLVSFAPLTVNASGGITGVYVTDASQLKGALEKGECLVVLDKDISLNVSGSVYKWCTTKGSNAIDLNGHTISINHDGTQVSKLIHIPKDSELVVYDSKSGGKIRYTADINGNGDLKYRDIFDVSGTLTINSGQFEAGRSVSKYDAYYAKTVYRQTYGSAVVLNSGAEVVINGGVFYGRGDDVAVIACPNTTDTTLLVNNGKFYAKGGADVFSGTGKINVKARAGEFKCETLGAIKINGRTTKGYPVGSVALTDKAINLSEVSFKDNDSSSATICEKLKIVPNAYQNLGQTIGISGSGKISGDVIKVTSDSPVLQCTYREENCYWQRTAESTPYGHVGRTHDIEYVWVIMEGATPVAYSMKNGQGLYTGTFNNKLNLNTDLLSLDGKNTKYTLKKNTKYTLKLAAEETLYGTKVTANLKSYDLYIVDDISSPHFTKNPESVSFDTGNTVKLSAQAEGTNVSYRWSRYNKSTGTWETAPGNSTSATYTTPVLTEADNGAQYRCYAYNSAGGVYSSACTLSLKNIKVAPVIVGLNPPVHGEPLDMTAETSSPGCKVTNIAWRVTAGGNVDKAFRPYAGMSMVCDVTVEFQDGYVPSSPAICSDWGDKKNYSTSIPTITSRTYSFMIDVAAPASGKAEITDVQLSLAEPEIGKSLPYPDVVKAGYQDTFSNEVRYTVFGGTKWQINGKDIQYPSMETVAADNEYTVIITVKPSKDWAFTNNTVAEINGEKADAVKSGDNLVITQKYMIIPEGSDPIDDDYVFPFTDVYASDWYYDQVKGAHQMGLIEGMTSTTFGPANNMTYAQAITLAARMHQLNKDGAITIKNSASGDWFKSYYDYCKAEGIIAAASSATDIGYDELYTKANTNISREMYVYIFARALPASEFAAINTVADNSIPDVKTKVGPYNENNMFYDGIYKLYRAGILTGYEDKSFRPQNNITRAEVATVLNRMMDKTQRVSF